MMNRILQSLAILGVNTVLGGLVLASFFLFLFRDDPILAAVPAILALPGIILQPWFILFFFLPGGPVVAPLLATLVSIPVYIVMDRNGKLEQARQVLARLRTRRAIAVTGAAGVVVVLVGIARYADLPAIHKGVPGTLQRSIQDMTLTLGSPRYYCLGKFIDSEWLWQARIPEKEVDSLADRLKMYRIEPGKITDRCRNRPPYWWRPVLTDPVRAFATTNFPMDGRGLDGWHALATWNPEDQILHMWIKDNF